VRGYSITIGPDGKPVVRQFGDKPAIVEKGGKGTVSEEREPLVDIIEDKDTVTIMAEVPGVSKEDIKLTGGENHLEINVDTPSRRYHKKVDLPCGVKLMTAKANYKNGVLEVVIDRVEKKKDEKKGGKEIKVN
jgi:HSP20 family protein